MTQFSNETKDCQNCKKEFTIEPEDFAFYKKIKVPPSTWCQECRLVRQMVWRNERSLYSRKCEVPGHNEQFVSIWSPQSPAKIYDHKFWWSDLWDALDYGAEYNFSNPFFFQFKELLCRVPQPN